MSNPFRYFNSLPEIIRLAVLMYVKYPLSLRNVWSEAVQENALILAPLESRDARRAGDLMRQHVARTGEVVRDLMDERLRCEVILRQLSPILTACTCALTRMERAKSFCSGGKRYPL